MSILLTSAAENIYLSVNCGAYVYNKQGDIKLD